MRRETLICPPNRVAVLLLRASVTATHLHRANSSLGSVSLFKRREPQRHKENKDFLDFFVLFVSLWLIFFYALPQFETRNSSTRASRAISGRTPSRASGRN